MPIALPIHILAGSLGLVSGFVALYAVKGAPLHRKAGMVFVVVMLTMSMSGTVLAALHGSWAEVNIPAALVTAYLVVTGVATVRPLPGGSRSLIRGAMLIALGVGLFCLTLGFEAVARGGTRNGIPAFPFLMFGVIGLLGSIGDFRMLRSAPLQGRARLARHLWRMCTALLIAAMSFFFGQADVIPKPIRIMPLLALPVLAVLVTMLYWVWRVRFRRPARGRVVVGTPEAA